MAERERGPQPDGADRSGASGSPADPATARPEGLPRQSPAPGGGASPAPLATRTSTTGYSPLRLAYRRGQQAADLRQTLDEKAAATDELREALDELRQVLDVDNPPPVATARRRGRLALLAIALLVVAALALWLFLYQDSGRIEAGSPTVSDTTGAAAPGGSSADAATPVPTRSIAPLPWPGGPVTEPPGLTTTGPGALTPGADVQVAVDPDGVHLDVFERLLLASPETGPLTLTAPTLTGLGASVRVQDLQVQLDDVGVEVSRDGSLGWSAAAPPGAPFTRVTLRYRVTGALSLVTPAAPGRALGTVTPLTGPLSVRHGHPVQVRSTDANVLGITCPTAPRGAVCGSRTAAGWVATIPDTATPLVALLQLNTTSP